MERTPSPPLRTPTPDERRMSGMRVQGGGTRYEPKVNTTPSQLQIEQQIEEETSLPAQVHMKPHLISVKLPSYDIINVKISVLPGFLVRDLKRYLNVHMVQSGYAGINPDRMRLFYNKAEWLDAQQVSDCGMDGMYTLDIVLRMRPDVYARKADVETEMGTGPGLLNTNGSMSMPMHETGMFNTAAASAYATGGVTSSSSSSSVAQSLVPTPGFSSQNYEYDSFVQSSYPAHDAKDVPIDTQVTIVLGPNPDTGARLVLPALLESAGWQEYCQSFSGLYSEKFEQEKEKEKYQPSSQSSPSRTPNKTKPTFGASDSDAASASVAAPIPVLAKAGNILDFFGGNVEIAKAHGYVKWSADTYTRRVFLVETSQSIYDDTPSMKKGINNSLVDTMVGPLHMATMCMSTKGLGKSPGKGGTLPVSATSATATTSAAKTFNPNESLALSVATSASADQAKEDIVVSAAKDAALHAIRYSWKGINRGYAGGDSCSWQRYTNSLPIDTKTELRRVKHDNSNEQQKTMEDPLAASTPDTVPVPASASASPSKTSLPSEHIPSAQVVAQIAALEQEQREKKEEFIQIPMLQEVFGYKAPAESMFENYANDLRPRPRGRPSTTPATSHSPASDKVPRLDLKSEEENVDACAVLHLPPVLHSGNFPSKDEILGLRLGQRADKKGTGPQWPSRKGEGEATSSPPIAVDPGISFVLKSTRRNFLRTQAALDEGPTGATYELVLSPLEPLKHDMEYLLVLANGVPVLPAADSLANTYAFAAAGQTSEDYLLRFRTVGAPPSPTKAQRKAEIRRARAHLRNPPSPKPAWVDIKTIDWQDLHTWETPAASISTRCASQRSDADNESDLGSYAEDGFEG